MGTTEHLWLYLGRNGGKGACLEGSHLVGHNHSDRPSFVNTQRQSVYREMILYNTGKGIVDPADM
jgi:hypothetical protein